MEYVDMDNLLDELERHENDAMPTAAPASVSNTNNEAHMITDAIAQSHISTSVTDTALSAGHCHQGSLMATVETSNLSSAPLTNGQNMYSRQLSSPFETTNNAGIDSVGDSRNAVAASSEDSYQSSATSCMSPNVVDQTGYLGVVNGGTGVEGFSDDSAICMADVVSQSAGGTGHHSHSQLPPDVVLAGPDVVARTAMDMDEDNRSQMDGTSSDLTQRSDEYASSSAGNENSFDVNQLRVGAFPGFALSGYDAIDDNGSEDDEEEHRGVPEAELHRGGGEFHSIPNLVLAAQPQPDVANFAFSQPDVAVHSSQLAPPDVVEGSTGGWPVADRHANAIPEIASGLVSFGNIDNDDNDEEREEIVADNEVKNLMSNTNEEPGPLIEQQHHASQPASFGQGFSLPLATEANVFDRPPAAAHSLPVSNDNDHHLTGLAYDSSLHRSEEDVSAVAIGLFGLPLRRKPDVINLGFDNAIASFEKLPVASVDGSDVMPRQSSALSLERFFLVPNVASPLINTPAEDPGFSKIPGFDTGNKLATTYEGNEDEKPAVSVHRQVESAAGLPGLPSLELSSSGDQAAGGTNNSTVSHDGGVPVSLSSSSASQPQPQSEEIPKDLKRPSEHGAAGGGRRSRPSSLLGLSKPQLPTADENTSTGPRSLPNFPTNYDSAPAIASPSLVVVSPSPAAILSPMSTAPPAVGQSPSVVDSAAPPYDDDLLNGASVLLASYEQQQQQLLAQSEAASASSDQAVGGSSLLKLKRPTSLTLPSREEYQPQTKKSPSQEQLMSPAPPAHSASVQQPEQVELPSPAALPAASSAPPPYAVDMDTSESYAVAPPSPMPTVPSPVATPVRARISDVDLPQRAVPPPPSSSNPQLSILDLGRVAPTWMPDSEAVKCLQCETKFTFTKRRHHCRACGKVFCSACCSQKYKLTYLENKEAQSRVCSRCYQDLYRAESFEHRHGALPPPVQQSVTSPRAADAPPLPGIASASVAAGTAALPPPAAVAAAGLAGVLRKDGLTPTASSTKRSVVFSDGIRPGGDLMEDGGVPVEHQVALAAAKNSRKIIMVERNPGDGTTVLRNVRPPDPPYPSYIPADGLPPLLLPNGQKLEDPKPQDYISLMWDEGEAEAKSLVFSVNKNLQVHVRIVHLDCCVNRLCWCYVSNGLCTVSQDEVVIILESFPDEQAVPRDVFVHYQHIYEEAAKGNTLTPMSHSVLTHDFLDSRDHAGFLYISPTFQCLQKLPLPPTPFLVGILLQKWEMPWARAFPIRLMLRLGAEFRYYPCQLTSMRFRRPVYGEIGHTIMNVLADFRNFQYTLPSINGLTVQMEDKRTLVNIPRDKYSEVIKVVEAATDNVIAFGATFSQNADSHLVCVQNDEGIYQTQAINIQNMPRKITGASFVIFNGSLKSASTAAGVKGKSSIVEDGLMVHVSPETLTQLLQAMKDMRDFSISCGNSVGGGAVVDEVVFVRWIEVAATVNIGVKSSVDGIPLDGVHSVRIHNAIDYLCAESARIIRWTEVFLIELSQRETRGEPLDVNRLCEGLARACCVALAPCLDVLVDNGQTCLGLRVHVSSEKVEYEIGSNGSKLPDVCVGSLDEELVPVLHSLTASNRDAPISVELVFHIINF